MAILAMLSSPYDGERATAGLFATSFLAKHNLMWADLTGLLQPVPRASETAAPPAPPAGDRRRSGTRMWSGYCRRCPAVQRRGLDMNI